MTVTTTPIRRWAFLAAASVAAASLAPLARAQQVQAGRTVDLAPRFGDQAPALYEHVLRVDTTQGVARIGEQSLRTLIFRRFEVSTRRLEEGQEDGAVAEAVFSLRRVAMRVERASGVAFDFDSDRPRVSDPGLPSLQGQVRALRALAAMDAVVRLDAAGRALEVQGLEPLEEIAQEDPGARILMGLIGRAWFEGMCNQLWAIGGDKGQAQVGQTWEHIEGAPVGDSGQTSPLALRYTLKRVEGDIAHIEGEGEVQIDDKTQILPDADAQIVNNKAVARCQWSLSDGRAHRYTYHFKMEVALSASGLDMTQIQDIAQTLTLVQ